MKKLYITAGLAALSAAIAACATAEAPASTAEQTAVTKQAGKDVTALNGLTSILIDAAALYRESAEISENADLSSELLYLAGEREKMSAAYQKKVSAIGGVPAERGEALGYGHRIFTDVRSAFEDDEKVAAREVLRGEQYIVDEMNKVGADPAVSAEVRSFVRNSLPSVESDRDRMVQLAKKFGAKI